MPRFLFLLLFSIVIQISATSQIAATQWLNNYTSDFLPEKVFVHTDKNIYNAGETIWMAVYTVNGTTHLPQAISSVVRVELRNPSGKVLFPLKVNPKGLSQAANITLPLTIQEGYYDIVAYTNMQLNGSKDLLFKKKLKITSRKKKVVEEGKKIKVKKDVTRITPMPIQLFPEGGTCIDGINCRVAFQLNDWDPMESAIIGYLEDNRGNKIVDVIANEFGTGSFRYTPENKKTYRLQLNNTSRSVTLDKAQTKGYHIRTSNKTDTLKVSVKTNLAQGLSGSSILVHQRGVPIIANPLPENKKAALLKIPHELFLEGVVTVTVFDASDRPVQERLVYIEYNESPNLNFEIKTQNIAPKSTAAFKVKIPLEKLAYKKLEETGSLSLAVLPKASLAGPAGEDIRLWMLINSDIDNPIAYRPELLYDNDRLTRLNKIDHFLMTRGWSRFAWEDIKEKKSIIEYPLEEGIYLSGRMTKFDYPTEPRRGKVFLSNLDNAFNDNQLTDNKGNFKFGPYEIYDTLDIVLQGRFRSGKRNFNNEISMDDNKFVKVWENPYSNPSITPLPLIKKRDRAASAADRNYKGLSVDMLARNEEYAMSIDLDELELSATSLTPVEKERQARTAIYANEPTNRVILDSLGPSIATLSFYDVLRRIAGVQVGGSPGTETVLIRGLNSIVAQAPPLFVLDGFVVLPETFQYFPMEEVEFIDVLKGASASIYGSRGSSGVIAVYTKTGSRNRTKGPQYFLRTKLAGYHVPKIYADIQETFTQPNLEDIRTTIYWNPSIITNNDGEAEVQFNTTDQRGDYYIFAQGLRADGKPIYGQTVITVE